MKLINREPIGRTRFLKLEKILALHYPSRQKKTSIDISSLAKDLGVDYGVMYTNWRRASTMPVSFEKLILELINNNLEYEKIN